MPNPRWPRKIILFQTINLVELFPNVARIQQVQDLWNDLLSINRHLSVRPCDLTSEHAKNFEEESKKLVSSFTTLYPSKHITPYMHCMMMHIDQFMTLHGAILPFTRQGLEKYNDVMTKDYFRSSSHRQEECLRQILQKQNRLEFLEHSGAMRPKKHKVTCENCQLKGHNMITCVNPCRKCAHPSFCGHLVSVSGKKVPNCEVL